MSFDDLIKSLLLKDLKYFIISLRSTKVLGKIVLWQECLNDNTILLENDMENKYGLPEYVVNSVYKSFKPNPFRFGITSLIEPPLIRTLKAEHWNEIEDDIADKLWMIHGNTLDYMIKKHSQWGLCNIRLETTWTKDVDGNDIIIVARPDYYNVLTHVLADLKDTSVWTIMNGKPEWDAQLNGYDYLMNLLVPQLPIGELQVHAFGKDWKKNEKLRTGYGYPQIPFTVVDIPRWSRAKQKAFIDNRLQDHLQNPRRECTAKERWAKADVWAVKKLGNRTAKGGKLCASKSEADMWVAAHPEKKWDIEFRAGSCPRCEAYCAVNQFCPYFKED